MNHKPGKRRLTWFWKNRSKAPNPPNTPRALKSPSPLGKMWEQESHGRKETNSWLLREPQAPHESSPHQPDGEPYPNLPAWPSAPERDRFGARKASGDMGDRMGGDSSTDGHAAPSRGQQDAHRGRFYAGRLRALWWKVKTAFRRPRIVLVAVASTLALCSILGVAALGNAFLHSAPNGAQGTSGVGSVNSAVASPSGQATPSVTTTTTAAPGNTQPPTPLTITFTCASGVDGGVGQLCVHTLPKAALSLSVRYCDNTYAKGKAFHGVSYADGSGNYTWRWNVNTTCVGVATATVTAKSAGQTVTQSATFTVTR